MIIFDKLSLQKFRDRQVREVFVRLIKKWCEGNKIEVLTEIPSGEILEKFATDDGFAVFCRKSESEKLDGSRITAVGEKWIFAHEKVTGRCGCGSSFRFAGDPAKAPKEFEGISILEAGTSHVLNTGNYFVYWDGLTEISVTGDVKIFSLELFDASEIRIMLSEEKACAELRSVVVGDVSEERHFTSLGEVSGASNRYVHEVLVLVPDGARANAKISADVRPGSSAYDVKIHESALLLGETGGVRGIPELKVASEDGLASHSATVERVSGEMLSYLASRGISRTLAQKTYLSARISQTYSGLAEPALEYLRKQVFKNLGF